MAQPEIKPGDALLYAPTGLFGWLIALKTWHWVGHIEAYIGGGMSVASRDGKGVAIYPLRQTNLVTILRPRTPFDLAAAQRWLARDAIGQKYDWRGLLRFGWRSDYSGGNTNNKQFCSEFLTRWYRAGGIDPFNGEDADAIAPFEFDISPAFQRVWVVEGSGTRQPPIPGV